MRSRNIWYAPPPFTPETPFGQRACASPQHYCFGATSRYHTHFVPFRFDLWLAHSRNGKSYRGDDWSRKQLCSGDQQYEHLTRWSHLFDGGGRATSTAVCQTIYLTQRRRRITQQQNPQHTSVASFFFLSTPTPHKDTPTPNRHSREWHKTWLYPKP